jgi:hypothetical protein
MGMATRAPCEVFEHLEIDRRERDIPSGLIGYRVQPYPRRLIG